MSCYDCIYTYLKIYSPVTGVWVILVSEGTGIVCLKHHGNKFFLFPLLTCICLMAGVPTEMTFNTTSTVMTSQRDNTMRHDNALPVTCNSRCASHRTMHMSYRSKTYTWNDVILVKRSMIQFFYSCLFISHDLVFVINGLLKNYICSSNHLLSVNLFMVNVCIFFNSAAFNTDTCLSYWKYALNTVVCWDVGQKNSYVFLYVHSRQSTCVLKFTNINIIVIP